ncbi:hypothetical protein LUZ63_007064 [Rhynchospora breviuscula]|uniref:Uncharacterized protein n=1 Tax=Rhynchospora breviuscula TaxID=2022672 RepID=A0A9Q0CR03_9POAL|nr:hypothetical protein LUZ63_007064 [Rhynchospora breviuscula]
MESMEKSRSLPEYSSSFSYSSGLEGLGYDRSKSYNFNGGKKDEFASSTDPEMKRKRRIASYNMFTMEANVKSSVRNSMKWIKSKISDIRYNL